MRKTSLIALSFLLIVVVAFSGCGQPSTPSTNDTTETETKSDVKVTLNEGGKDGADCTNHSECLSGVCDHYKADNGKCATSKCTEGEKSDNNNYFCNKDGKWEASKEAGDNCEEDYECFKPTCFMIPTCELTDIPRTVVSCKEGVCVKEIDQDECEEQGMIRALHKDDYMVTENGDCIESMEQRVIPTICIPCGDGTCDEEMESVCNCPEDCGDEETDDTKIESVSF